MINKQRHPQFIIKLSSAHLFFNQRQIQFEIENGVRFSTTAKAAKPLHRRLLKQEKLFAWALLFMDDRYDRRRAINAYIYARDKEADKDIAPLLAEYALKKRLFAAEEGASKVENKENTDSICITEK